MIDLEKRNIILGDQVFPIRSFQVWWAGPLGLVPTLEQAFQTQKTLQIEDAPFHVVWKAIPVAVSDNGVYEQIP